MKWSKALSGQFVRLLGALFKITAIRATGVFQGEIWTEDILNSNKEFDNPLENITTFPSTMTCISHCALRSDCGAVVVTPEKDSLICRLYTSLTGSHDSDGSKTWNRRIQTHIFEKSNITTDTNESDTGSKSEVMTCVNDQFTYNTVFQSCLRKLYGSFWSWTSAIARCAQENATRLVVVDTTAKLNELKIYTKLKFWVGGSKVNGTWKWINGQQVNMDPSIWFGNRPSNKALKDCLFVLSKRINHVPLLGNRECTITSAILCEEYTGP